MKQKLFIIAIFFTTFTSYAQFIGGNNDGHSSGQIATTIQNGAFVLLDNLYKGGNGGGFSKYIITSLLNGENTSVLFYGSDGDGFNSSLITVILYQALKLDLYMGGPGDGNASKIVRASLITLDGIEEFLKLNVLLYPNPANHIVHIKPNEGILITSIQLYDISGKKVIVNLSNDNTINVNNLSDGVYLLNIYSVDGAVTKKLIVKHF